MLTTSQGPPIDLGNVTKPGLKSCALGLLVYAASDAKCMRFGVTASLWKGASGGPCVLLEGPTAGAIVGMGKFLYMLALHFSNYHI